MLLYSDFEVTACVQSRLILYGAVWQLRICIHISKEKKVHIISSAYCMKVQPLLDPMVHNISVNSASFFRALQPKSGCLSEKSDILCIFRQSDANLASTGIIAQPLQAQVESYNKSSAESVDHGMAEIQAI